MPKLDTHRHFSYELLTAFLGDLLAVPQVNVTDVSTAFEEGQALVSNLIAVCRGEETARGEGSAEARGPSRPRQTPAPSNEETGQGP